jgi:two-component system, sensor histidine kinase
MDNGIQKVIKGLGLYFYKLAEQSNDVFWVRSANLESQLYVSPSFCSTWGHSRKNLYQSPEIWPNSIHPDDRTKVLSAWKRCITHPESNEKSEYSYRITCANGEERNILDSLFPVFDEGELVGVAGVSKLVSSTQNKQEIYSEKFLELLERDSNRAYWLKNRQGEFSYLSRTDFLPWGITEEELQGDKEIWKRHLHPDDTERLSLKELLLSAQSKEPGQNLEITYRLIQANSSIVWLKDTYCPSRSASGQLTGFSGYTEVITSEIYRERQLNQAKKTAANADKCKTDFLAMVSHELRTPLNAILGMAQLMSSSNLAQMQKDQLEVIISSGKSLLGSMGDLLDCAKLDLGPTTFSLQATNLESFLSDSINEFKNENLEPTAEINLRLEHDGVIPDKLYIDQDKVNQIITNLLVNALNFTTAGNIQVKTKCLQQNHNEAVICLTVEDSGAGIQKSELNQIFNQLEQTKSVFTRSKDCLGLGLVIVRELVERMGGSLAVSSEPGYGSQFSCIIPMATKGVEDDSPKNEKPANNEEKKKNSNVFDLNVLVVEDNPINQKITKIMLEQVGCRVDIADCGELAIEKMNPDYDMVFMDIGLPDIDGFETTSKIRSLQPLSKHTPIVAMTAHVFSQDRERCFQVGMDEVIAKPILREDLVSILKRWVDPVPA